MVNRKKWIPLSRPLVSICIPTYNPDVAYLHDLLESIERQTWPEIEIVISDDSSENFNEFTATLPPSRFPRTVTPAMRRLGMTKNWNESARLANGEFLLVVGQDDRLEGDGVERLVAVAIAHDVDLVFGGQGYIGADGNPMPNPSRSLSRDSILPEADVRLPSETLLTLGLSYGNILADPCSTLIRKSAFDRLAGFSDDFRHAADLELWMRFAAQGGEAVSLRGVAASHRSHNNNATTSHIQSGLAQNDRVKLHAAYGSAIRDDQVWNRSVARLYLHGVYDMLCHRVRPVRGYPKMRGTLASRASGWFIELAEVLRFRKPNAFEFGYIKSS